MLVSIAGSDGKDLAHTKTMIPAHGGGGEAERRSLPLFFPTRQTFPNQNYTLESIFEPTDLDLLRVILPPFSHCSGAGVRLFRDHAQPSH